MEQTKLFTPPVVTLIFLSFVMGTSEFMTVGIMTDLAADMAVSISLIGGLVAIFAASYVIGTPLITMATAQVNKYTLVLTLTILFGISNLLPLISGTYVMLLVSRILTAAVSGALLSIGMALSLEFTSVRYRSKTVSWIYAGFSISSVVSIPLASMMSHSIGWRSVFVMILVMTVIAIVSIVLTLPRSESTSPERESGSLDLIKDPRMILGVLIATFSVCGIYVFYTFITPILEIQMGVIPEHVSICLMVFGAACIISNLSSSRIADRGGMRYMPIVFGIQSILMALLPISMQSKIIGIAVVFLIVSTMYLINAPNQMHFVEVAAKDYPHAISLASSLNPVAFNIGTTAGSFIGSVVVDTMGLNPLGYISAMFSLLALISVIVLIHYERKIKEGDKSPSGV